MNLPGLSNGQPGNVLPAVSVGKGLPVPIMPPTADKLIRAVVDTHLHLPDMFELTYDDQDGDVVEKTGLHIGAAVKIAGAKYGERSSTTLIEGEVTSIEAICENLSTTTVIRGYEKAHRLQRARRSQTFVNMTDSDIARQVAANAGLRIGTIESTRTTHPHVSQVAQTDWEFLTQRAREIGFEWGVLQGKFYFRRASGLPAGGALGAVASAASAVGSALGMGNTLTFKENLFRFYPRVSGANITPDVEVRVWDSRQARVVVSTAEAKTGTADLDNEKPAALANSFTDGLIDIPSIPPMPKIPGIPMPDFGTKPSKTAFVVVDRPLGYGSNADKAADDMAKGLADHVASTFAEAEGEANGDPALVAGIQVEVKGVPSAFTGKWTITSAKHVFDPSEHGYRVQFQVSGRSVRSMLALASTGTRDRAPQFQGLVCGVVTNVKDPDKRGRVKVALPWLSKDFETDWARVAQLNAGPRTGAIFLPEVGDEVLIGFEFGDARRPYVVGGLINDNAAFKPLKNAVSSSGAVTGRGFASPAGNQLLFTDELPPGPTGASQPLKSAVTIGTGDGNLALSIDQVAGTVTLSCKPAPPASHTASGTLTIDCSGAGQIAIKGGAGGVKVESDGQLELSGKLGVKISSNALVQVQGQTIQLN